MKKIWLVMSTVLALGALSCNTNEAGQIIPQNIGKAWAAPQIIVVVVLVALIIAAVWYIRRNL